MSLNKLVKSMNISILDIMFERKFLCTFYYYDYYFCSNKPSKKKFLIIGL